MRKDPTEFRERFLRWKNGEQVYENGLALPAYEDGKDANNVPSYAPSIDDREQPGYRKYLWELSKARRNAFLKEYGDAAPIKNYYEDFLSNSEGTFNYRRWYNLASPAERKYGLKKGLAHWADADGKTSLHPSFSIESPYSGYKNPYNPKGIIGGKWIDDDHYEFSDSQINNDWPINKTLDEFDRSRKEEGSNTYAYYKGGIMLHEPTIIGKIPKYKDGLTPLRKSEVNTNLAIYNPEEDLYTGRYTLPEVTITGDKSKRVYHSHAPRTSGISKNYQKWDTTDLLSAMTTGSDVGDAIDIGKDLYNQNYINAGIGAAMFAVPNFIEKPLKPVGRFARNFVINNNDKISTLLAKSGVVKRAMNYAMHLTDAANPTYYILKDIGIKGYGSRNPSNVSIDEIKSFLLDRSKDKTKLKLVASYILFGKNKNKVIKDHTGITGIDYQTNKTFNTNPASGFIGPKESVLFGKDMTAGKIENLADYGVHSNYITRRPDLTPRRIYSTDAPYRNGLPTVDDDFITHTIPRTLSSLDDYMPIKTPFGIGSYDAGGHLIELGRGADKKYYLRGLDIYKFDAVDYAKKHLDAFNNTHDYLQWAKQHPFLNLGLTTVLKAVKPIIVRSRWTPVDQVLDSYLTPNQVKKQIREVYDQLNQSALMYLVPRMNSYIK